MTNRFHYACGKFHDPGECEIVEKPKVDGQEALFGPGAKVEAWCASCRAEHPEGEHRRDLAALEQESRERTVEAIARVDRHADDVWKQAADDAILYVARRAATFTADDVWWRLEEVGVPAPKEPRALGARMQAAARAGIAENTRVVVKSRRPETHGSWVAQWASRLASAVGT